MITYEQIAEKYADAARSRRNALIIAQNKIERVKAQITAYKQIREEYRQPNGVFSADNARAWRKYTDKLRRLECELSAAELNLATLTIGTGNTSTTTL